MTNQQPKSIDFEIRDFRFHEEALREIEIKGDDLESEGTRILITWHTTAIAYLQYGEFHGFDGPAAEALDGRTIVPREVNRKLDLDYDDNGLPFMRHTFKE